MAEKTEVLYDVSNAVKELERLDRKVVESSQVTERSFEDRGSRAVNTFNRSLVETKNETRVVTGELIETASGVVTLSNSLIEATGNAVTLGATMDLLSNKGRVARGVLGSVTRSFVASRAPAIATGAAIVATFASATGVIALTISSIFDLAEKLRDVNAGLDVINQTAERTLKLRQLAGAIGDADENRRLEESRRSLTLQSAQLQLRQNELQSVKDLSSELVNARQREFNAIDQAFQRSVNNRQKAERRLEQKRQEAVFGAITTTGRPAASQIVDLSSRAQQEAQKGNIDLAEKLIDRAKQLSDELGNHSFFTNKIESANQAVVRALEDEVKEAKTQENELAAQRQQLKGRLDDSRKFEEGLERELAVISRQRRALQGNRRIIQESAQALLDLQTLSQGQERAAAGIQQIQGIAVSVGGQSELGQFRDAVTRATTGLRDFNRVGTIASGLRDLDQVAGAVGKTFETAFQDGVITPLEASELTKRMTGVSDALGLLERGVEENRLSSTLQVEIERIRALFQGVENLAAGAADFRAGGGGLQQGITTAAVAAERERVEQIIERREIQQNITLNINGTVIDDRTLKRAADVLKQELRKGTITNLER